MRFAFGRSVMTGWIGGRSRGGATACSSYHPLSLKGHLIASPRGVATPFWCLVRRLLMCLAGPPPSTLPNGSFSHQMPLNPDHDEVSADRMDSIAESAGRRLEGLHAKTYVADAGWRARVWTGSANATDAAFHGNVEFLVELGGKKGHCGVDETIGGQANRLGFRKLVESYEPSQEHSLEPTEAECIAQRLDRARRAIGGLRYTATCADVGSERWLLSLASAPIVTTVEPAVLAGIRATVRPVTLGRGSATALELDASTLRSQV